MKKSLKEAANILARGRRRAFVSRVAWFDLERIISSAFKEISESKEAAAELGDLYLISNRDYPPFNSSNFSAANILNEIQIHAGWRQLNLSRATTVSGTARAELMSENGAALWFSQDATGSVIVFVAPYKSKVMSMNEDNIILARYNCATSVSDRDIRRHFSTFFRYCAATSVHGNLGLGAYIYRLRLRCSDFRNRTQMRANAFRYLESLLAAIGIVAALYAGDKLFS